METNKQASSIEIRIIPFDDLSTIELYQLLQLRSEVFVVEQNCVYQDIDNFDLDAIHVLALDGTKVVAYARLLKGGTRFSKASIGRVVVHADYRGNGVARHLMQTSIQAIFSQWNASAIHISAQQYLERFYQSLGFITHEEPYLEDGIPHVGMDLARE
jgi:ElaA protein